MMKPALLLVSLLTVGVWAQTPGVNRPRSPQDFINVEGPDLPSRLSAAIRQGSSQRGRFWAAYTFAVKPGVAFDVMLTGSGGSVTVFNSRTLGSPMELQNQAAFLLYESGRNAPVRAEIYNLDRPRDYAGYPVYWLGRVDGEESLSFLRSLVDSMPNQSGSRVVDAIAAHDESRVPAVLRDVIRAAKGIQSRTAAVSWLGRWPDQAEFLATLVRDERELAAIRREAAEAIGESPDAPPLPLLQELYRSVTHREVKRELLETISDDRFEGASLAFLIETAEREADRDLRGTAIEALGERTDTVSLQALEKAANNAGAGVELQQTAVEAISERVDSEAVPLLKKIARSHPRRDVRQEALDKLGERPDQLPFLLEIVNDRGESIELRRNAIEAVAQTESSDAMPALKRLLDSLNSRELKEEVIERIADSGDRPGAITFLIGIAQNHGDTDVRKSAVEALGDMNDERAIDALSKAYDSTRDEATKNEILDALSDADSPRALQKLMAVAQRDSSVKLRKRAIELLGESDDPVAVKFLEQLIK